MQEPKARTLQFSISAKLRRRGRKGRYSLRPGSYAARLAERFALGWGGVCRHGGASSENLLSQKLLCFSTRIYPSNVICMSSQLTDQAMLHQRIQYKLMCGYTCLYAAGSRIHSFLVDGRDGEQARTTCSLLFMSRSMHTTALAYLGTGSVFAC